MKNQLLCCIILAICGSAYAQVPNYVPSNGLVGWWPFNGNANDESGNGNNGTVNGASLTTDQFGRSNKAYYFNGINNYINIPNNSIFNFSNNLNFTYSFWIRLNVSNSICGIIGKETSSIPGVGYQFMILSNNLRFDFMSNGPNEIDFRSAKNLNDSNWHNIVFVANRSSNSLKLYIDGQIESQLIDTKLSGGNVNNSSSIIIGAERSLGNYFNGEIDDIGIWNRALDSNQVKSLYTGCNKSITQQPVNQGMYAGNATFSCATDDTLVSYQWQINAGTGWNTLNDAGQVAGSTTKSLNINNVTSFNNNQKFRCIIKGNCLTDTTQEATLRVWGLGINGVNLPEFKLYPNPSSNAVTIAYSQNPYSIAVYNSLGQMVLSQNAITNEHTFDISQWPKGVYYVELIDAATQTNKVQKLIRN